MNSTEKEKKKLTIDCDDDVRKEKHENDKQKPDDHLGNPSTMVPSISSVISILHTNHYKGKYCKKQEIPHAHTKNCLYLIPFLGVSLGSGYPYRYQKG